MHQLTVKEVFQLEIEDRFNIMIVVYLLFSIKLLIGSVTS